MKWFGPGYGNEMVSRKLGKEPELCNFVFNFLYVFKKCIYKAVKCKVYKCTKFFIFLASHFLELFLRH